MLIIRISRGRLYAITVGIIYLILAKLQIKMAQCNASEDQKCPEQGDDYIKFEEVCYKKCAGITGNCACCQSEDNQFALCTEAEVCSAKCITKVDNCKTYTDKCTKCDTDDGYHEAPLEHENAQKCAKEVQHCKTYQFDTAKCSECDAAYATAPLEQAGVQKCVTAVEHCKTYSFDTGKCQSCDAEYVEIPLEQANVQKCALLVENCKTYDFATLKCTMCTDDEVPLDDVCALCTVPNCKTCANKAECTEFADLSFSQICTLTNGYYESAGKCLACAAGCLSCDSKKCLSCYQGSELKDGKCVKFSSSGSWYTIGIVFIALFAVLLLLVVIYIIYVYSDDCCGGNSRRSINYQNQSAAKANTYQSYGSAYSQNGASQGLQSQYLQHYI